MHLSALVSFFLKPSLHKGSSVMTLSNNSSSVHFFGKLGIGKWRKQEFPFLVVDPLNLPKDWPVYQLKLRKNKANKRKQHLLVFWYGSGEDPAKAFSFILQNEIISLDKEDIIQRLDKVLAKPKKNANNGALRRSFEELKPDLDKSVEELRRKFYPENQEDKRPVTRKRRPSPKAAGNRGKRRFRGPVIEDEEEKVKEDEDEEMASDDNGEASHDEPQETAGYLCPPEEANHDQYMRDHLLDDLVSLDGEAAPSTPAGQASSDDASSSLIDSEEDEAYQAVVEWDKRIHEREPLEMASQPLISTSEDPVGAEPLLQQKVIASEDQTRAQPKAPPKQNQKATEVKKSSSKKAGKAQDSSWRGGDDRCIARIRIAQENGKYGPPKDIWLSELEARKDGIQEYSIGMKQGGQLRFIAGMVSPEQCNDVAKEMETIEYRRYPLKSLNALEPRVHLLLSKTANPPANKTKQKKSISHGDSEEDPDYFDGECQDDCRVESLPETAKGYKYHSVNMLAHPISDFKAIERVDEYVADFFHTDFNIGVDALCYRNGKDHIGFHADDTQGEDIVVSLTVESLCQRVLRIKPKGDACVGDEQIDLFPCAGDGYSMDGNMQCHYLHSLQKAVSAKIVAEGRRFALIFRNGKETSVGKDTGKQVESLKPDPNGPVEYSFGVIGCVQQGQEYTKSDMVASGAHRNFLGGVSGNKTVGCDAITVSRNSPKYREEDRFSWLRYSSNVHQGLRALNTSWREGKLVRVFRSSNLGNHFQASSSEKNRQMFRYDGLYKVTHVWNDKGEKDPSDPPKRKLPLEYTFLLERSCCDENLNETDFFAKCKQLESMPAFLEHTIDWTEQSKAPTTLPPIQPKVVLPSSVTQVSTSEPTTPECVPPLLGEETSPMVEETRRQEVETGMQEPADATTMGQYIMMLRQQQMMGQGYPFYGCKMGYSSLAPGYGGYYGHPGYGGYGYGHPGYSMM